MKGKLIKFPDGDWVVEIPENNKGITGSMMQHFASTFGHGYKLSLKNCQAIERGYDLDELANKANGYLYYDSKKEHKALSFDDGYKAGFQTALEILGDKKFSEEDLEQAIIWAHDKSTEGVYLSRLPTRDYIQSIQQTEWDVEIEMDILNEYDKPKLDADGCLILKLKSE